MNTPLVKTFITENSNALDTFRPNEDDPDNDADPQAVLYDTLYFGNCPMHVWAISIIMRSGYQHAENPDYESDLRLAQGMIGGHHGHFSTVAYRDRRYAIIAIPHGQ